jgi:hypothetical protein
MSMTLLNTVAVVIVPIIALIVQAHAFAFVLMLVASPTMIILITPCYLGTARMTGTTALRAHLSCRSYKLGTAESGGQITITLEEVLWEGSELERYVHMSFEGKGNRIKAGKGIQQYGGNQSAFLNSTPMRPIIASTLEYKPFHDSPEPVTAGRCGPRSSVLQKGVVICP